jgi:thiol-disulfide isomerase/thioredoxin
MKTSFKSILVIAGIVMLGGCQQPSTTTQPTGTTTQSTSTNITQTEVTTTRTPLPQVGLSIGNRPPEFFLTTLQGENVSLSKFLGHPMLLNFWATWCPPCQFEMPYLQQVNDKYSPKGLVLLAVDAGEKESTIRNFMTSHNLSMTVPMDRDISVAREYNITNIPKTFFIDKEGVIRDIQPGAFRNLEDIEDRLNKIMQLP